MNSLTVILTSEQLDDLADRIAARLRSSRHDTLSISEAAGVLGVSIETIRRRVKDGTITPIKGTSRIRFTREEIDKLL